MTTRPSVLVTDGEERAALAVVRSLGRAGYPVFVVATSRHSMAGASRSACGSDVVADPLASPDRFVEDVASVARRRGVGVILPITDAALLALVTGRERLGDVALPWPDGDCVRRLADKAAVLDEAREIGIAVPAQRVATTRDEATAASRHLRFPLVIKPSRSVRERASGPLAKLTVAHARDAEALASRLSELDDAAFPALLQERIVGPGVGVSLLVRDGQVLASFSHRRLRERPPAGGVSVYAESIPPDGNLVERSAALLRRFAWDGVAMVEYKIDSASGAPYLMEINGRFWGSLQLAIDAGVDFPVLLLDAGRAAPRSAPAYRAGVRFRWWWGDVDHLLVRLARSPTRLSLPPDAPSRARVVRDFVAAGWSPRNSDVYRSSDRRPFLVESLAWLRARLAAAAGRGDPRSNPVRGHLASPPSASPL